MFAVTIDGPSGVGKSSISKEVAGRLGFVYVDTGALYRTLALYLIDNKISLNNADEVEKALPEIKISIEYNESGQRMKLGGKDVTDRIRTPQVSMATSDISKIPAVRSFLFSLQKTMAQKYNVVMDGRDIGTVILPEAQVKIFLTAQPEERARRRYHQLLKTDKNANYDEILRDVIKRDEQDSQRETAPLRPAKDAVIVDSTNWQKHQTVAHILKIVSKALNGRGNS